jgi:hypothetical protein
MCVDWDKVSIRNFAPNHFSFIVDDGAGTALTIHLTGKELERIVAMGEQALQDEELRLQEVAEKRKREKRERSSSPGPGTGEAHGGYDERDQT